MTGNTNIVAVKKMAKGAYPLLWCDFNITTLEINPNINAIIAANQPKSE